MMFRASASELTVPVASICIAMLPSAVASTGPASDGPPGRVRRELIQQPVARSAADDPDRRVAMSGQLLERLEDGAVLERQALEDRPREAGLARRLGLAGLPAVGRDRRRHVRRMEEPAVVRIEERSERVPSSSAPRSAGRRTVNCWPASFQRRMHACSSHRPPMFLSSRVVPQTPPSLVKFSSRAFVEITGARHFGAEQRPRARAEERAVAVRLDRRERRSGVVTRRRDDRRVGERGRDASRMPPMTAPGSTIGWKSRDGRPGSASKPCSRCAFAHPPSASSSRS